MKIMTNLSITITFIKIIMKPNKLKPYQVLIPLPSVKKKPALLKGSYISHKFLDNIEKRTTYYSSLCSKYCLSPQKPSVNLKNLQPILPQLKVNNKRYACKKRFKTHMRAHSDLQILVKNNLIELDEVLLNNR